MNGYDRQDEREYNESQKCKEDFIKMLTISISSLSVKELTSKKILSV